MAGCTPYRSPFAGVKGRLALVGVFLAVGHLPAFAAAPAPQPGIATQPTNEPTLTNYEVTEPAPRGEITSASVLIHLPGIAGARQVDVSLVEGLRAGGVGPDSMISDWTDGEPGMSALLALARNRIEAQQVAALIIARHRARPDWPIYLTAHSGGTGIAVWALENLPADVHVHTVVLLSSALSPTYDLSKALSHVDGKLYSFYSSLDALVLGTGTTLFGTIDGVRTESAGKDRFRPTPGAQELYAAKVVQIPYDPAWTIYRNFGDHMGPMHAAFAEAIIAPLLLHDIVPPPPVTQPAH